ncbi:MAG: hypothetical protein K6A41_05760 [Bacteroidales bacterium]|nr:hypothetical protein [Bacteroidales bacterium]
MEVIFNRKTLQLAIFDVLALSVVYFLPALAHLTAIPLRVIEPFRIVILLSAITLGSKRNAYALALTMPLFSFIITGHPVMAKMFLISLELLLNVFVLDLLSRRFSINPLLAITSSIVFSKIAYYLLKYLFISQGIMSMSLFSMPILQQVVVALATALIFAYFLSPKKSVDGSVC